MGSNTPFRSLPRTSHLIENCVGLRAIWDSRREFGVAAAHVRRELLPRGDGVHAPQAAAATRGCAPGIANCKMTNAKCKLGSQSIFILTSASSVEPHLSFCSFHCFHFKKGAPAGFKGRGLLRPCGGRRESDRPPRQRHNALPTGSGSSVNSRSTGSADHDFAAELFRTKKRLASTTQ